MVLVTEFVTAKIVLAYLSRQQLSDTFSCFLKESQNFGLNNNRNEKILSHFDDLELLPCLEDILTDYFATSEIKEGFKTDEKAYLLWKQLDVVVSQLRTITLSAGKARAFLRSRKPKNGVNINDWKNEYRKNADGKRAPQKEQGVQTEEISEKVAVYNDYDYNPTCNDEDSSQTKETVQISHCENETFLQSFNKTTNYNLEGHHHETPADITPHQESNLVVSTPHKNMSEGFSHITPIKEMMKKEVTKDFKSPKRKSNHPKRRSNTGIDHSSLVKLPENSPLKSTSTTNESLVSPLLGNDDFSQMLKAMFVNSTFQEKLANNINKVTSGETRPPQSSVLKETEKNQLDVEEVVKLTSDELDLSELFAMLGDLNHEYDDTKKQLFFPASTLKADKTDVSQNSDNGELKPTENPHHQSILTNKNHQNMEQQTTVSNSKHSSVPANSNYATILPGMGLAENYLKEQSTSSQSNILCQPRLVPSSLAPFQQPCLPTTKFQGISLNASSTPIQTVVRNLNTDLTGDSSRTNQQPQLFETFQNLPITSSIAGLSLSNLDKSTTNLPNGESSNSVIQPDIQPAVYESQESYHDIESSPACSDVATPSKLSYTTPEEKKPSNSSSSSLEKMKPLHDSESIATDALLLLSTSPAKPEYAAQSQFSFLKLLTEPLNMGNFSPSGLQPPSFLTDPVNTDTSHQDPNKITQQCDTFSASYLPTLEKHPKTAYHFVSPRKAFFEKPHDVGFEKNLLLPKILPKTKPPQPPQPTQPLLVTIAIPKAIQSKKVEPDHDGNLFSQLQLNGSADVKRRQNERKRRSREKKNMEKKKQKEFVVRNLTFGTPNESALLTEARNIVSPYPAVVVEQTTNISSPRKFVPPQTLNIAACEFGSPASLLALKLNNTTETLDVTSEKVNNNTTETYNPLSPKKSTVSVTPQPTVSTTASGVKNEKLTLESNQFTTIRIHNGRLEPSPLKEETFPVSDNLTLKDAHYNSPVKTAKVQTSVEESMLGGLKSPTKSTLPQQKLCESPIKQPLSNTELSPPLVSPPMVSPPGLKSPRSSCLKRTCGSTKQCDASRRKVNSTGKVMKVKFSFPAKSPKAKDTTATSTRTKHFTINTKEFQASQFTVPFKKLTIPIKPLILHEKVTRLTDPDPINRSELKPLEKVPELVSVNAANKISFSVDYQHNENTSDAFEIINNVLAGLNDESIEIVTSREITDCDEILAPLNRDLENDVETPRTSIQHKTTLEKPSVSDEQIRIVETTCSVVNSDTPIVTTTTVPSYSPLASPPSSGLPNRDSVIEDKENKPCVVDNRQQSILSVAIDDLSGVVKGEDDKNRPVSLEYCKSSIKQTVHEEEISLCINNGGALNNDSVDSISPDHQNHLQATADVCVDTVIAINEDIIRCQPVSKKRKYEDNNENDQKRKKKKSKLKMEKLKKIDVQEFLSKLHTVGT